MKKMVILEFRLIPGVMFVGGVCKWRLVSITLGCSLSIIQFRYMWIKIVVSSYSFLQTRSSRPTYSSSFTELRGYKQVRYIDISGWSPSYNYIRGWLISKTNPSEPLTSSAGNQPGQFYFLPRKKKGRLKELQRLICSLTLIDWAELPCKFLHSFLKCLCHYNLSLVMEDRLEINKVQINSILDIFQS